jgi:hypothetical protein
MCVTCLFYCCTTDTGLKPNCSLINIYKYIFNMKLNQRPSINNSFRFTTQVARARTSSRNVRGPHPSSNAANDRHGSAMGYGPGLIPGRYQIFFSGSQSVTRRSGSPIQWVSPGVKRPERVAHYSSLTNVELENGSGYTSTPPRPRGVSSIKHIKNELSTHGTMSMEPQAFSTQQ